MAIASACLGAQDLERLRLGQLSFAEVERLAEHLEQCGRCAAAVQAARLDDSLAESLHRQAATGEGAEKEVVAGLIARLKRLPLAGTIREETTAAVTLETRPATEASKEVYDFLAPAEAPGELGRLGSYRILRVLGCGGMGVVFLAEDSRLRRRVALKAMRPALATSASAAQRFLREAQATAQLKHDHIVTIYQVGEDCGAPFLAMELLEGEALESRLQRDGRLPLTEALRIAREMAEGLAAAHAQGLIHRDVKPANVWLEARSHTQAASGCGGRVKLLDFGLARVVRDEAHLTQPGAIVGTPAYMAPEQARGEAVDGRCDLFSLGCVLYRMTTGAAPFKGIDIIATLLAVTTQDPPPPRALNPEVPPPLNDLILRLLAKGVADRPASARAVAEALEDLERTLVSESPPPAPRRRPETARKPARRLRLAAVLALLVLLPLGYFFGGALYRIATNKGELIIESDDPNIEVTIKGQAVTVHDKVKDRRFVLTAGDYEVEVREEGEGGVRFATRKFTITRGGKETFQARLEPVKTKTAVGGERNAAEWVLSLGGTIAVVSDGKRQDITPAKDLPAGPFRVVAIGLGGMERITDAGLEHLKALTNLTLLDLNYTKVGDAGLAHLKTLTKLTSLHLVDNTQVSDAGLAHLKTLTNLTTLGLNSTKVGDAGLAHLKTLTNLTNLDLDGTKVSDAGLAHLIKALTNLTELGLDNTKVSDAGLAHLKTLTNLTGLRLMNNTQVSDAGLAHLKTLTNLTSLNLTSTQVGDAGLAHLKTLTNLTGLNLGGTKVTAVGADALRKALPKCKINGPAGKSAVGGERNAAEWVLSVGGTITVVSDGKRQDITPANDLPAGPFRVVAIGLGGKRVTDAGLEHLKTLTNLTNLALTGSTKVSDAGLEHLKTLTNLTSLGLAYTQVGDAGLEHLKTLTNLTTLDLYTTKKVGDAGLAHLKTLTKLTTLNLSYTQVGDAGLAHLKTLTKLTSLHLTGSTQVGDAGLAHLKTLTNLTSLGLGCTQVSDAGLEHLKALTKLASLHLSGTQVSDAGLERLKALTNLLVLDLRYTKVGDAGLAHLKTLTKLTSLHLVGNTQVSDAGLAHLKTLTNLTSLDLSGTKVTAAGADALRKALPKCKIDGPAAK